MLKNDIDFESMKKMRIGEEHLVFCATFPNSVYIRVPYGWLFVKDKYSDVSPDVFIPEKESYGGDVFYPLGKQKKKDLTK